jgi:dihydrofolate reductase
VYGGWALPYFDAVAGGRASEGMAKPHALLLGRRTYEDFYSVWPNRTDNPFTEALNNTQKYVVSRTLDEPLPWMNSTLLEGEASETVAALKETSDKDLVIVGSGELVQSLMQSNLVDEYALSIHPLILGSGRRLFVDGSPFARLQLVEATTTTTGVVIATYRQVAADS